MDGTIQIGIELEESAFTAALQRLQQTAGTAVSGAMEALSQRITQIAQAMGVCADMSSAWSSGFLAGCSQIVTGAQSLSVELLSAGTQAGSQLLAGLLSADTLGTGKVMAAQLLAGVASGSYVATGRAVATALLSGFESGQSLLTAAAGQIATGLQQRLLAGSWYSVGYQISAGIASGLSGGSSLITAAANRAATAALQAAKTTLGIHSPSEVFRKQVGQMIPAGIAEGIVQGSEEAVSAMEGQAQLLVDSARSSVLPVLTGLSQTTTQLNAGVTLTLETPVYLDGREIARATAKYTEQQLQWEEA